MTKNHMCILKMQSEDIKYLKSIIDPAWLWYCRYVHINFNSIYILLILVRDIPTFSFPYDTLCESCICGKQHWEKFSLPQYRNKILMEFVHAWLYKPIYTSRLSKCSYMLIFTNNYSHMSWLYLLEAKSNALATFLKFKVVVENKFGFNVNQLYTNHGG